MTAARADDTAVVVLVSGGGTNLQALIDATTSAEYGVTVTAVGADRYDIEGLSRAQRAGIPTFVCRVEDFATRGEWDVALTAQVAAYRPSFVVSAGFMKLLGAAFLAAHRTVNTHPALLPSFPGAHAVRDALAAGVTVTGCTGHLVDSGVDTGPVLAQRTVEVHEGDTEQVLHDRIKAVERPMLVELVGRLAREGFPEDGDRPDSSTSAMLATSPPPTSPPPTSPPPTSPPPTSPPQHTPDGKAPIS